MPSNPAPALPSKAAGWILAAEGHWHQSESHRCRGLCFALMVVGTLYHLVIETIQRRLRSTFHQTGRHPDDGRIVCHDLSMPHKTKCLKHTVPRQRPAPRVSGESRRWCKHCSRLDRNSSTSMPQPWPPNVPRYSATMRPQSPRQQLHRRGGSVSTAIKSLANQTRYIQRFQQA
jgi:hypothetical protein